MQKLLKKGKKYNADEVAAWCYDHGMRDITRLIQKYPPKHPFKSDGASCFPDVVDGVNIYPAALAHDIRYWCGLPGDKEARFLADLDLARDVVAKCGGPVELGMKILLGVRVGGTEWLPTTWRWGFGR